MEQVLLCKEIGGVGRLAGEWPLSFGGFALVSSVAGRGQPGPAPGIPRSHRFAGSRPLRFAKGVGYLGYFPREWGNAADSGIPCEHRFARSRPLTFHEGDGRPQGSPLRLVKDEFDVLWVPAYAGMTWLAFELTPLDKMVEEVGVGF